RPSTCGGLSARCGERFPVSRSKRSTSGSPQSWHRQPLPTVAWRRKNGRINRSLTVWRRYLSCSRTSSSATFSDKVATFGESEQVHGLYPLFYRRHGIPSQAEITPEALDEGNDY